MSAFDRLKGTAASAAGSSAQQRSLWGTAAASNHKQAVAGGGGGGGKRLKVGSGGGGGKARAAPDDSDDEMSYLPKDDFPTDSAIGPLLAAGMGIKDKKPVKQRVQQNMESEHHDYIRDRCLKPSDELASFAQVLGGRAARMFAEQWVAVSKGALRAITGLLLYGPPGTGKTVLAQAVCGYIGGTFYQVGAADLPTGKAGADRIDALFDVAMAARCRLSYSSTRRIRYSRRAPPRAPGISPAALSASSTTFW